MVLVVVEVETVLVAKSLRCCLHWTHVTQPKPHHAEHSTRPLGEMSCRSPRQIFESGFGVATLTNEPRTTSPFASRCRSLLPLTTTAILSFPVTAFIAARLARLRHSARGLC